MQNTHGLGYTIHSSKYTDAIAKLKEEFNHRFAGFKTHRDTSQVFVDSFFFNVEDDTLPPSPLQMELIDLQCNSELKFREVNGKTDELGQFMKELPSIFPAIFRLFTRPVWEYLSV